MSPYYQLEAISGAMSNKIMQMRECVVWSVTFKTLRKDDYEHEHLTPAGALRELPLRCSSTSYSHNQLGNVSLPWPLVTTKKSHRQDQGGLWNFKPQLGPQSITERTHLQWEDIYGWDQPAALTDVRSFAACVCHPRRQLWGWFTCKPKESMLKVECWWSLMAHRLWKSSICDITGLETNGLKRIEDLSTWRMKPAIFLL